MYHDGYPWLTYKRKMPPMQIYKTIRILSDFQDMSHKLCVYYSVSNLAQAWPQNSMPSALGLGRSMLGEQVV